MCLSACFIVFPSLTFTLCISAAILLFIWRRRTSTLQSIPGPRGYPIVGHMTMLGDAPQEALTTWSKQYGSVYRLKFGVWPVVIVSGYKTVYEALVKQGDTFADRPAFQTFKDYANGASMSFHTYDASLKAHRRVTSSALKNCALGHGKTELTQALIWREGLRLLDLWSNRAGSFDPCEDVTLAIAGILYSLCFGHDRLITDDESYVNILTNVNPTTEQFAAGNHVDLLPWRKLFISKHSHNKNVERMRWMTALNQEKFDSLKHDVDASHIMGYMIEESKKAGNQSLNAEQLVNTTVEFLSAGTETSSTTLLWAIIYMAHFPEIQEKAAKEILDTLGPDHLPTMASCARLPYTEATVFEIMRLTTIVPFALPHCTTRDTRLGDYHIPKGTLVYMNLWSVGRDPHSFHYPEDFNPDRFLIEDPDYGLRLNRDALRRQLPFGAGKRKCIGEVLGKTQVMTLFTLLLQRCRIVAGKGKIPSLKPNFGDILKPKAFDISIEMKNSFE
ncbi:hypothetical protein CAPTEDRAFT_142746 [Capitella teleta]|uniref:Cytochrome P450 n=1 Tax=Capitella teleta TaxID=283909 RepID=R7UC01_CAPTE|nr:hypothetical protein CAPTEDRAFT_142746 [Capitella teleta]|eukprot:ELU01323.1 hypothetical protein CAPTEDRAFT_142746 [Capitella teleta]